MNLPPKVRQKTFGGIFMSKPLSLEKKLRVVALYERGSGVSTISQQLSISKSHTARIVNRYLRYGNSGLERLPTKQFSVSFKQAVVSSVLKKCLSFEQVALQYQISPSTVYTWVCQVKSGSCESLSDIQPRGRPPKDMGRPKKRAPQTELENLQERVAYLEAENA
ncbi:MAG: helix-turn-helix domain-containing protein, partial [Alistipes sp.]